MQGTEMARAVPNEPNIKILLSVIPWMNAFIESQPWSKTMPNELDAPILRACLPSILSIVYLELRTCFILSTMKNFYTQKKIFYRKKNISIEKKNISTKKNISIEKKNSSQKNLQNPKKNSKFKKIQKLFLHCKQKDQARTKSTKTD